MRGLVLYNYSLFYINFTDGLLDVTLEDVLIFFTGCDREPPLGFSRIPELYFLHDKNSTMATASTCSFHLIYVCQSVTLIILLSAILWFGHSKNMVEFMSFDIVVLTLSIIITCFN